MKKVVVLSVILSLSVCAIAADTDWEPARSWVFIVGLLEWKHPKFLHSFPKAGRRDTILAAKFKELGVPEDHVVLMQDAGATTDAVNAAFKKFAERPGKGDTLFVYFCGHGYKGEDGVDYFATYDAWDTAWAVSSIFDTIEAHFHGAHAVLLADCCNSGAMANLARTRTTAIDYACLTSVAAGDTSTNCWTFSDSLLDVLEGKPQADLDGGGVVTFGEAAHFIDDEMRFFDEQTAASSHLGKVQNNFRLAVVKQPKSDKRIGERVEVLYEGEWWRALIEDVKDGKVKVYYASAAMREEGWVAEKDIREFKAKPAKALAAGMKVNVEWQKRWWPAKVEKLDEAHENGAKYFISYDGYGREWDEWVTDKRIRARP